MQQVYAAMIVNDNSGEERKNDLVEQLNKSFEAWFKADISLFTNLAEKPPWYGHRRDDLIQTLQEQTIYKFCTFNMNSISALSDEKIYFSQPKQLNDPFDMDGYLETIKKDEFEFVSEEVKNKVLCFCSTLQKDNLQMWAHYADSFTGICIGYEFIELPKDIAWRSIYYSVAKNGSGALVDTLFVKSKNWAYEEEVRFLKFSDSPQLVSISPNVNEEGIKGYISELILGSRFDMNKNGPVLRAVLKELNARYDQAGRSSIDIYKAVAVKSEQSDTLEIKSLPDFLDCI